MGTHAGLHHAVHGLHKHFHRILYGIGLVIIFHDLMPRKEDQPEQYQADNDRGDHRGVDGERLSKKLKLVVTVDKKIHVGAAA